MEPGPKRDFSDFNPFSLKESGSSPPKDRVILHCDLNNFYASVECLDKPYLKNRPVAVCGDPERRHGIVLAKNEPAKRFGIQTGEPLCVAKAKCPAILFLPAHPASYKEYSQKLRRLYRRYTDQIESFGIDECFLDVTGSLGLFGTGEQIANELRTAAKATTGLTISAGVSFNKTFSKMGSDYKKPDATTLISRNNYKELLWPLPVENMLFAGRATAEKLRLFGIHTIGELALTPQKVLEKYFGKAGVQLHAKANGFDPEPVQKDDFLRPPESIGNSLTCPFDLVSMDEVRPVLFMLCDSVSTRLRRHSLKCRVLVLSVRTNRFENRTHQKILSEETHLSTVLFYNALSLYEQTKQAGEALRGLGICAKKLTDENSIQLSFLDGSLERAKKENLEQTVDRIRERFGNKILGSALYLTQPELCSDHPLYREDEPFRHS